MHADTVASVSSDTLVRLASGLSEQCVKKQCGLAGLCFGGCMVLNLLSRIRTGIATMGQDCHYQLDITRREEKEIKNIPVGAHDLHSLFRYRLRLFPLPLFLHI
jgi:dienelactone hydrolase